MNYDLPSNGQAARVEHWRVQPTYKARGLHVCFGVCGLMKMVTFQVKLVT